MELHDEVFSPDSPVAGWTPAPDAASPEGLVALLGGPRPAARTAHKNASGAAGPAPRAARGSASAGSKGASLIAPFRERISAAGGNAAAVGSSNGNVGSKVLQPCMSHRQAGNARPAAPLRKMPGMLTNSTATSSSTAGASSSTSNSGSAQQQEQAAAGAAAAAVLASSRRHSRASSARPASQQAAVNVAAAEAAVSAAAAVMKVGTQPHHQQQQRQQKALPLHDRQQQLRRRSSPVKPSIKDCSSSFPQPGSASTSSSQYLLLEPLRVHGTPQSAARQGSACAADDCSGSPQAAAASCTGYTASCCPPAAAKQAVATSGTAAMHLQRPTAEQLHYRQLMLCQSDSAPQTAAQILATRAKSRRMRIQQRNLLGPAAFLRAQMQARPGSPPPVVLDGALLLASCPGAEQPADVLFADLNSVSVSSVALPNSMLATQHLELEDNSTPAEGDAAAAAAAAAGKELAGISDVVGAPGELEAFALESAAAEAEAGEDEGAVAAPAADISELSEELPAAMQAGAQAAEQPGCTGPGLQEFSQLCALDLSDNRLSCIAGLAWLPALQQLILAANRLRDLQSLSHVLGSSCSHITAAACLEKQQQATEQQQWKAAEAAAGLDCSAVAMQGCCPSGFGCLRLLDVSFNLIPAEQLLGASSPLAQLPRLATLYAAGNSLKELPQQLAPFTCLSCLDLSHNRLSGAALLSFEQLPALQQLLLSHNPIRQLPASGQLPQQQQQQRDCQLAVAAATSGISSSSSYAATGAFQQLTQLDLSHTLVAQAGELLALLQLPRLAVLLLVGTPLAARCCSGSTPVQDLEKPGLCIITQDEEPQPLWTHSCKAAGTHKAQRSRQQPTAAGSSSSSSSSSSPRRLLPVTVDTDAAPGHVLAAAGRNAIMGLQHQQLVAAFDRVEQGIDSWQLAPVAEEGSEAWDEGEEAEAEQQQQHRTAAVCGREEGGLVVDQTFLTGVGITGELPGGDEDDAAGAGQQAADAAGFQDPTERLALALGLQVSQLAHHTHKQPGNSLAATDRLRHALAHPLVDAEAGMQSPQHHTGMTAAALAKQRPRQLLPLPQPIPVALDTRVKGVQGLEAVLMGMRGRLQALEGTVLQQLQAQSDKLSAVAQAMRHNAAECSDDNGGQADQPAAEAAEAGAAEE